ncbi:hypothetical protein ACJX0J_012786, partial [Zea mays]
SLKGKNIILSQYTLTYVSTTLYFNWAKDEDSSLVHFYLSAMFLIVFMFYEPNFGDVITSTSTTPELKVDENVVYDNTLKTDYHAINYFENQGIYSMEEDIALIHMVVITFVWKKRC